MSPKKGAKETDPDYFEGDDGAAPCTRRGCGRWTGLRDQSRKPRCARCQLRETPTCDDCAVVEYEQVRGQTGEAVSVAVHRRRLERAEQADR